MAKAKGATIQDVARLAGVSPSTVSNMLNGRFDRMQSATRERIYHAIKQLNYEPNLIARHLKTGYAPNIGLIVPSVANPFWGMVARYVEEAALEYGYQVLLCNAERDAAREQRYAETLWSSGVRGVIFGSSPLSFEHIITLAERGMRVIAFDRQTQGGDQVVSDSVSIQNQFAAQMATSHLIELGHRRIGFLSGPIHTLSRIDRLQGYRAAMMDTGTEPEPRWIWEEASAINGFGDVEGVEIGRAGAHELLSRPERPTALIAVNDMYALGAYAGARDLGLNVPDDVSVVGFDDLAPLTEIAVPPLTTVRQPIQEMMRIAVERLIGRIEETHTGPPEHTVVTPELIVRASTSHPKE